MRRELSLKAEAHQRFLNFSGFGFITFSSAEETDNCFQAGPHSVDDKVLDIKKATPREDKEAVGPKSEVNQPSFQTLICVKPRLTKTMLDIHTCYHRGSSNQCELVFKEFYLHFTNG